MIDPIHPAQDRRRRGDLQREHDERRARRPRQPGQREVRHDGELYRHQQLEEMCLCAFIGLANDAMDGDVAPDQAEQEDGYGYRKPRAPLLYR